MLSVRVVFKSKGNARHFWNCVWLTAGRGSVRAARARLAKRKYTKCFRLLLKSKGNACLFLNYVWRTIGRGASWRRDQTKQTKIYYRIVYFCCAKCLRFVFKSKGNARNFWNCVWLTDGRGAGGQSQSSQTKIYKLLPINIEKQRKRPPFLKLCLADGYADTTYSWLLYYKNRNRLQKCLFLLFGMLAISIERQRKRPPFLKLGLADGWAGGGRPGPH